MTKYDRHHTQNNFQWGWLLSREGCEASAKRPDGLSIWPYCDFRRIFLTMKPRPGHSMGLWSQMMRAYGTVWMARAYFIDVSYSISPRHRTEVICPPSSPHREIMPTYIGLMVCHWWCKMRRRLAPRMRQNATPAQSNVDKWRASALCW